MMSSDAYFRMGSFSREFTEANVAESLVTYYAHGKVGANESFSDSKNTQW